MIDTEYKLWLRGLEVGDRVSWREKNKVVVGTIVERSDDARLRISRFRVVSPQGFVWADKERCRVYPPPPTVKVAKPRKRKPKVSDMELLAYAIGQLHMSKKELARKFLLSR